LYLDASEPRKLSIHMDKRGFLKATASLAVGAVLPERAGNIGFLMKNDLFHADQEPIIRTLGSTGLKVPVVSSGIIPQNLPPLIRKLFESGIKHFDSAWDYQNGRNDLMLRDMLREFGRDNFIISTKVLLPFDEITGQYSKEATTKAFMDQLEVTMTRLGVDCVDILYLHKPPTRAAALNEDMLKGLQLAKQQGKARFLGISNHGNQVEMIAAAIESKMYQVLLLGYNFRQESIVKPALERAKKAGLGIVAMKVFAGEYQDKERNKPLNKVAALKWVLQNENVHTSILTFRTYEDYSLYMPIMFDIEMSEQEKHDLAEACQSPGLYCLGCGKCRKQCPGTLPLPDLMRAYMYTYGYKSPLMGKQVLQNLRLKELPCRQCTTCMVKCTMDFDIKDKVADILRLRDIPDEFLV
jgi:uncharacterized protein